MRVLFLAAVSLFSVVALASCGSRSASAPGTPVGATETPGAVLVVQASTDTETAGTPTDSAGLSVSVPTVADTPTVEPPMTPVPPTPTTVAVASPTPTGANPPATATSAPPKNPATPGSIPPTGPRTVTLADAGTTINLKSGDSFLLALGETWDWTVTVDDPTIVSRQVNILVIRGAQGVYNAHKPGRTILRATGDPRCRQANPPCGMLSRVFEVTLVVQ